LEADGSLVTKGGAPVGSSLLGQAFVEPRRCLPVRGLVEHGVTVLVTTHFMDEAEYCDRIALIYRAQEIATGTPDELKAVAGKGGVADLTLEDAFIALIEESDRRREAA